MYKILIALFSLILLSGCMTLRSAKGMKPGEVMVSYNAPLAGDVRVGITKNIEARYALMGEAQELDLFYHLHNKNYDLGFALGYQWLCSHEFQDAYNTNILLSRQLNKYFSPYISYTNLFEGTFKGGYFCYFNLGCEIFILDSEKSSFNVVLTPELGFSPRKIVNEIYNSHFFGAVGIGFSYDFMRLFNKKE